MKRTRISDIARILEVSPSTVSRAINYKEGISDELREKILNVAQEMNYSFIAKSNSKELYKRIGVIIPDISNQFFSKILYGVQSVLIKEDFSIFFANTDENSEIEENYLKNLMDMNVDGIISAPSAGVSKKVYYQVLERGIPVLFFDRKIEGLNVSSVTLNNYDAVFMAIRNLVENGHKRIACVSGIPEIYTGQERLEAFKQIMKIFNLQSDMIITGNFNEYDTQNEVKKFLSENKPTAIFSSNNKSTLGLLETIKEMKLKIPDDLSIIGFDPEPWTELLDIATISQPRFSIGSLAAQMLLREIQKKNDVIQNIVLSPELRVNNSIKKIN